MGPVSIDDFGLRFAGIVAVDSGPQKCGEQVRPPKVSAPIDDAIKQVKGNNSQICEDRWSKKEQALYYTVFKRVQSLPAVKRFNSISESIIHVVKETQEVQRHDYRTSTGDEPPCPDPD